jgi:hypothetical protein
MHVSTFGGGETGCAAAIAVLDLLDGALLEHVHDLAACSGPGWPPTGSGSAGAGWRALTADDPDGNWGTWRRLRDAGIYTYPATFTSGTRSWSNGPWTPKPTATSSSPSHRPARPVPPLTGQPDGRPRPTLCS